MSVKQSSTSLSVERVFDALTRNEVVATEAIEPDTLALLFEHGIQEINGKLVAKYTDFLRVAEIEARLSSNSRAWIEELVVYSCISSTNTILLDWAKTQPINGHVLTAEVQLAGRGRRGRQWVSPFASNLMFSVGATINRPATELGSFSLAIGVAVAKAFESFEVPDVALKWPNDVLVNGKKGAGILIELAEVSRPSTVVIGIGINIGSSPGIEITSEYAATALNEYVNGPSRNQILANVLNEVVEAIEIFERKGLAGFADEWSSRDALRYHQLVVTDVKDITTRGFGLGIDESGAYRIRTSQRIERVIAGTLRRA